MRGRAAQPINFTCDGMTFTNGFVGDLLGESRVVVELKAVERSRRSTASNSSPISA